MDGRNFKPGDRVVFSKPKHSTRPGPRAKEIFPSRRGESYSYFVDKYWLVVDMRGDEVVVQTRSGKCHVLATDDPNLRHASWWDRLVNRHRFPSQLQAVSGV